MADKAAKPERPGAEPDELAEVMLLLRAPPAAAEEERDRVAVCELGQRARAARVVGERNVREDAWRLLVSQGDPALARASR